MRALALAWAVAPERQLRAIAVGARGELLAANGTTPPPTPEGLSQAQGAIEGLDGDKYLPTPRPTPEAEARAESLLHTGTHASLLRRLKLWAPYRFGGGAAIGEYDVKAGMKCGQVDHGELAPAFETSLEDCKALCDGEVKCCGFGHSTQLDGICARKTNCGICDQWGGDAPGDFYVKRGGPKAFTKDASFPVSDLEADRIRRRIVPKLNVKVASRRRFAKFGVDAGPPRPGSFSWTEEGDGKGGAWHTLKDAAESPWYGSAEEYRMATDGEVPHEGPDAQPYDEWRWYWEPNDAEPWMYSYVGKDHPERELTRHMLHDHGLALLVSMGRSQLVKRDGSCEHRPRGPDGHPAKCSLGDYWCGKLAEAGLDEGQAARVSLDDAVAKSVWLVDGQPTAVGAGGHSDACPGDGQATVCAGGQTFGWGSKQAKALAAVISPPANEVFPSTETCKRLGDALKQQSFPAGGCQNVGGEWTKAGSRVPVHLTQNGCQGSSDQKYEFVGCFGGGSMTERPAGGDVPATAAGVQQCRDRCARYGHEYFGFECPHASGKEVHCECGSGKSVMEGQLTDQQCAEFNQASGSHCAGPFTVTSADAGKYLMGAGAINSVYKVAEGTLDFTVQGSVVTKGNLVSGQVSADGTEIKWSNGKTYTRQGAGSLAQSKFGDCELETAEHPDATACEWFCHETEGCSFFSFVPGSPTGGQAAECRLFSGCTSIGPGGDPERKGVQALFTTKTDPQVPRGGPVESVDDMAKDQCIDLQHALREFDDHSFCAKHKTAHKCAEAGAPCFFQTGAERVMRTVHDSFVEALRYELLGLSHQALENLHSWDHAAEWRKQRMYAGFVRDHQAALDAYESGVVDVQAEHSPQVREWLSLYLPAPKQSMRVDLYTKGLEDAHKYGTWLSRILDFPSLPPPPQTSDPDSHDWFPSFVANWTVFQKGLIPMREHAGTRAELQNIELINGTCERAGAGGWVQFRAHWANNQFGLHDIDLCCVKVQPQDCEKVHSSFNGDGKIAARWLQAWYVNSLNAYEGSQEWQDRQTRSSSEIMDFARNAYATAGYPVAKAPFEQWWDASWFTDNAERWKFPGE